MASQLEQHGVVEKLIDGDILAHPLAPTSLDHEFARKIVGRLGLQGAQHNGLVERVPRHDGPVVKHLEAKCLALRVGAEIEIAVRFSKVRALVFPYLRHCLLTFLNACLGVGAEIGFEAERINDGDVCCV